MMSEVSDLVLGESVGVVIGTRPPRRPLSSASLALWVSSHELDLEEVALTPSLHNELPVELVLSDRLGVSVVPTNNFGLAARSSCEHSSNGVRGRVSVLLVEVCLLETEGVRDLSQDVSRPLGIDVGDWSFDASSMYTVLARCCVGFSVTLFLRELREDNDNCVKDRTEDCRKGGAILSGDTSMDPRRLAFFGVK